MEIVNIDPEVADYLCNVVDETFEEWVGMSNEQWRAKRNCQLEHDHTGGVTCIPRWIELGQE